MLCLQKHTNLVFVLENRSLSDSSQTSPNGHVSLNNPDCPSYR